MNLEKRFFAANVEPCRLEKHTPAPYFRYEFKNNGLKEAKIAISGLGFYRLFINGKEITRGLLSPYISNLDQIIYYDLYDLKPYLQEGANCVGVMLGNGMRNPIGAYVWSFEKGEFTGVPCFALEFEGKDKNGEDLTFNASHFKYAPSPVQLDDIRAGEWYDARLEIEGWCQPGFNDGEWENVVEVEAPKGEMRICCADPIVKTQELKPISINKGGVGYWPNVRDCYAHIPFTEEEKNQKGYIFDFGVNAAGRCRLKIKNSKPGQKIIMQFGEILGEPDSLDPTKTNRNCNNLDLRFLQFLTHRYNNRDVYICKGAQVEEWEPHFTYHGFRYCLIMGVEECQVDEDLLTYEVMNSDLKEMAQFECSNQIANALWDATKVSNLANFYHFPTDCPHREKNGWTGDAALSAEQMTMSLSVDNCFKEWLRNIYAAFNPNGSLPSIVPSTHWGECGPAWDSVLYYIPYCLWQYRGDRQVLLESAEAQLKYLNFIKNSISPSGLIEFGLGDWCQVGRSADDPQTPNKFSSTLISIDICEKSAQMLKEIGKAEEAKFALDIKETLLNGARKAFIDGEGKLIYDYQTALAMAIYYGILTDSEKAAAQKTLLEKIKENNGSFACGILGLRVLFHVLTEMGESELAFNMITKKEFPSYGYWIDNGFTSLGEYFNPIYKNQSSCNHHFFGDIISWFMQNLVGIKVDYKADGEITVAPKFIKALDFAKGSVKVPNGTVSVSWKREGKKIIYKVSLPQDVKAKLILEEGFVSKETNLKSGENTLEISIKE